MPKQLEGPRLPKKATKGSKKFQSGGRVRAGNAGMADVARRASRARNSQLERDIGDEELSAQGRARAERATGGRYQDPPTPRRAEAGDSNVPDARSGNPRGITFYENFMGPAHNGRPRGEDVRPGRDNSVGTERARAYGRADQAAMQEDTDREVRHRFANERAYKRGGAVRKAKPAKRKGTP